jgi:FAD binding domain/Berberine and berberine like
MKNISISLANKTNKIIQFQQFPGQQDCMRDKEPIKLEFPQTQARSLLNSFTIPAESQLFILESGELEQGTNYVITQQPHAPKDLLITAENNQDNQKQIKLRNLTPLMKELCEMAFKKGFLVAEYGSVGYDKAREISNSFFRWFPCGVAFPKKAEDVALCLHFCQKHKIPVRICSGGHQHEGMSSANGVLMIRLSAIDQIEYVKSGTYGNSVWIPAGKKLQNVYKELGQHGLYIPGGACESVNPGGLVLGGGWGPGVRMYGMTCDNVLAIEIVLEDGTIKQVKPEDELFRALCGGGGGNFGIVTRFLFKEIELPEIASSSVEIPFGKAKSFIKTWMDWVSGRILQKAGNQLLITLILNARHSDNYPVIGTCNFRFLGDNREKLMEKYRDQFLSEAKHKSVNFFGDFHFMPGDSAPELSLQEHDRHMFATIYPTGPRNLMDAPGFASADGTNPAWLENQLSPPKSTCDAPHPHKVSSAFQKSKASQADDYTVAKKIVAYLSKKQDFKYANAFIVLHALGGKSAEENLHSVYNFRDRKYLLQFEAWWSNAADPQSNDYIKWVTDFRAHLIDHVDGAFINFVDNSLVPHPETPEGRIALLEQYYGKENLAFLREVKKVYDPKNFFEFPMSIPLP